MRSDKHASKLEKLVEVHFVTILFTFCFCYNFITHNHWIVNNTSYTFTIFRTSSGTITNIFFFAYKVICFSIFTSHRHLSLLHFWSEWHFLLSNIHSQLDDICFVIVFLFIYFCMRKCIAERDFAWICYAELCGYGNEIKIYISA